MKILILFFLSSGIVLANPLASGTISIDNSLKGKAQGIRTLYVTVRDAKSSMPMPWGALKIELTKDAEGEFYTFNLTPETLMLMAGGDAPMTFDLKVRLDKDGMAGKDSPGDLLGGAKNVKRGATGLKITIDKEVH